MYKLGQYVWTFWTGSRNFRGRIIGKHHSFEQTSENEAWFKGQKPELDISTKEENWYSILTENGGSVLVPESGIGGTLPEFKLANNWESYYF